LDEAGEKAKPAAQVAGVRSYAAVVESAWVLPVAEAVAVAERVSA